MDDGAVTIGLTPGLKPYHSCLGIFLEEHLCAHEAWNACSRDDSRYNGNVWRRRVCKEHGWRPLAARTNSDREATAAPFKGFKKCHVTHTFWRPIVRKPPRDLHPSRIRVALACAPPRSRHLPGSLFEAPEPRNQLIIVKERCLKFSFAAATSKRCDDGSGACAADSIW
jgi:hypothetical protein